MHIWLVGAGAMATDYFKVLTAQGVGITVIGRGQASARKFEDATGTPVIIGGLGTHLGSTAAFPDAAIVCVSVETLAATTIQLIEAGVTRILVEKPAAIDTESLTMLTQLADDAEARVFVGYNRRYYAATRRAKRIIEDDGGLLSCNFEFSEWADVVEKQGKPSSVKEKWFLANSTHVADLAFHLAGVPVEMNSYTSGSLPWHPSAAAFAGAGITERGVLFSYQANWTSPGRWGVEALTARSRLIFRPMETLQIMHKGSVLMEEMEIDDALDKSFKPGLYEQVLHFLGGEDEGLCDIAEQLRHWPYYYQIGGY